MAGSPPATPARPSRTRSPRHPAKRWSPSATLRQAADLDYRLTVLADGCLDADPEVHQVLLGKVFHRQAEITSVGEWAAGLRRG